MSFEPDLDAHHERKIKSLRYCIKLLRAVDRGISAEEEQHMVEHLAELQVNVFKAIYLNPVPEMQYSVPLYINFEKQLARQIINAQDTPKEERGERGLCTDFLLKLGDPEQEVSREETERELESVMALLTVPAEGEA